MARSHSHDRTYIRRSLTLNSMPVFHFHVYTYPSYAPSPRRRMLSVVASFARVAHAVAHFVITPRFPMRGCDACAHSRTPRVGTWSSSTQPTCALVIRITLHSSPPSDDGGALGVASDHLRDDATARDHVFLVDPLIIRFAISERYIASSVHGGSSVAFQ